MKTKKIKTILFNPVHPVKKIAATLLLSAGWWLSLSGTHAATVTSSGVESAVSETYTGSPSHPADHSHTRTDKNYVGFSYFEYCQINPNATLTIDTSSPSGHNGGAFYLEGGGTLATAGNVTFASCVAGRTTTGDANSWGGAIYFNGNGLITHAGSGTLAFIGNQGSYGGVIASGPYTINGATDTITLSGDSDGLVIASNVSGVNGGVIYANAILLNHSVRGALIISGNQARSNGGVFFTNHLTLSGTYGSMLIASNTGGDGGVCGATDIVIDSSVSGNLDLIDNSSGDGIGGALAALRGNLELRPKVGGTLNLSRNLSGNNGGALYTTTGTLLVSGSYGAMLIASNTAKRSANNPTSGGAFYTTSGPVILSATVARNLVIRDNTAIGGNGNGAGGAINSDGRIELRASVGGTLAVSGNFSPEAGAFKAGNSFTLGGSYGAIAITANSANDRAGAIRANGNILLSATVAGNLSISGNTAASPGAVYSNASLRIDNRVSGTLLISGNVANNGSGGAFQEAGSNNAEHEGFIMAGHHGAIAITSNTATGDGGAFYGRNNRLWITATAAGNLTVSGNTAGGNGGAFFSVTSLTLDSRVGGTLALSGNTARDRGGAFNSAKDLAVSGSFGAIAISSNTTGGDGGALYNGGGSALYIGNGINFSTTVASNLTVSGNTAGGSGGAFFADTTLTFDSRVGGTLVLSGNTARSHGGAFNSARALAVTGSYGAIAISSNITGVDGGALYTGNAMNFSTTVANNLSVSGNRAGQDGGAFFAAQNLTLNHNVGGTLSFSGNYAARAGGAIDADGALNLSGSYRAILITSNTAGDVGGAFYAGNGFNLTLAASTTLTASGNKAATNDDGGFLYVDRGDLVFDLGAGALAQIGNANSVANQTDSIAIYASVSVYKRGTGTLQLWANNPFSDNFYVNAGVLDLRGKLSSNRTEVASGATLKGSGTTVGSVVIYSGGTIAPGDGPGVLTTGTLTLNDGAALSLNLDAASGSGHTRPAGNSLLVINGNLTSVGTAQIDLTLTAGPVNGAVYDLIKYTGTGSGNVNIRKLSGSGATGVKISDFKIVNSETGWLKLSYSGTTVTTGTGGGNGGGTEETWDLAGLTSKGLKLSAAKTLVVPKGVKLLKGTKAIYTWKRDGATVLSGSGKNFTAKDSGTYTLTLSYTTADGQQHSQTQNFGKLKLFAQPKTATLTMTQTTDTITNSALRGTSVVSGETLKLTASVGTVGGGAVGPFRYVWYCGSAVVRTQQSSATTDTFTTPAYGDKAVGYKCVVELVAKDAKNKPLGTAKSKDLKAKIILPPSAVTLSASATTVKENGTLTLSATAKGTATLLFTWYKNGAQIATGSAKKFAKKPVTVSDAGTYYVVVSQDKTTRRAQSATLTVSVQRADGTTVSGAQSQSAPRTASPAATAATSSADPRRQDAAVTLSDSAASSNSASVLNLAPLKLSAGDVLTVSGSATREYIILNETQHSTGAYRYEWRDNLTAEFQDADDEAHLTLRFITSDGGVYELSISGSVNETGVFELRKK